MIVKEKKGNLATSDVAGKKIDFLALEWYETSKRILHKKTEGGTEVTIKFLNETQVLEQGDIIYHDQQVVIAIDILVCDTIVIQPDGMFQMAMVCYEIGNKHLPLFYEDDQLLVPYELPLTRLLNLGGYSFTVEKRKLLQQLKTSVAAHVHSANSSLFSKILQLTSRPADAK